LTEYALLPVDEAELFDRLYKKLESEDNWYLLLDANVSLNEINPVDSAGSATKKRGIVIRSASELDEFNRILANQKLVDLARKVDLVNPKQKESTSISSSQVFEI
jgi:hypothetical protein